MLLVLQSVLIFGRVGASLDASAKEARKTEIGQWLSLLCSIEKLMAETEAKLDFYNMDKVRRQLSKNVGTPLGYGFDKVRRTLFPGMSFQLNLAECADEEDK